MGNACKNGGTKLVLQQGTIIDSFSTLIASRQCIPAAPLNLTLLDY